MKLIVKTGPMAGLEWTVATADATIGRDPHCELVLPDEALSRRHCRLLRQADGWVLLDLDSTNGVRVNGVRPKESQLLRHGDQITIGRAILLAETDPNRPLRRTVASVAADDSPDPWLFGMVVFAAALLVVALSLLISMPAGSSSNRGEQVAAVSATEPQPSLPLSTPVAKSGQPALPTSESDPPAQPQAISAPAAANAVPMPPAPPPVATEPVAAATTRPHPVSPQLCPACQRQLESVVPPPPEPTVAAARPEPAVAPEPLPEFPIADFAPAPGLAPPVPRPRRDTLAIDRLLRYSPELPLAEEDAAAVVRVFEREWQKALLARPVLDSNHEVPRQRRLKTTALAAAINGIADLEATAGLEMTFLNSPDCWVPENMPNPPVLSDWVPTRGLQGVKRVVHDGMPYELRLRHEVKGYDYGYHEPGRHLIYRLTLSVNDEVLLQQVYDLRSMPQPPTAGVLGPHDLPGRVQRKPANSLFRHYAEDCSGIFAPMARIEATATRDPIPRNYISRIPATAWDYRDFTVNWRRQTGMKQWQRLVREAVAETLAAEFNGVAGN